MERVNGDVPCRDICLTWTPLQHSFKNTSSLKRCTDADAKLVSLQKVVLRHGTVICCEDFGSKAVPLAALMVDLQEQRDRSKVGNVDRYAMIARGVGH